MAMPDGIGDRRPDDRLPDARQAQGLRVPHAWHPRRGDQEGLHLPRRVHVQGRPRRERGPMPTRSTPRSPRWTSTGSRPACSGSDDNARGGRASSPRSSLLSLEVDPNDVMKTRAQDPQGQGRARPHRGHVLPRGLLPAGERRCRARVPGVRDLHRPRHPDHRERRASPGRDSRRTASTSSGSTASATTSPNCAS